MPKTVNQQHFSIFIFNDWQILSQMVKFLCSIYFFKDIHRSKCSPLITVHKSWHSEIPKMIAAKLPNNNPFVLNSKQHTVGIFIFLTSIFVFFNFKVNIKWNYVAFNNPNSMNMNKEIVEIDLKNLSKDWQNKNE